jgi:hypothetical protein
VKGIANQSQELAVIHHSALSHKRRPKLQVGLAEHKGEFTMVNIKENFKEWRKEYEAADEQTKALMEPELEKYMADKEKEHRESIVQAIKNLTQKKGLIRRHGLANIASDIHMVTWAARDYLKIDQLHKWHMQLLKSEWKLLHQFIVEQARRIDKVRDISELSKAARPLICYAACYIEGLQDVVSSEYDYLDMLAREPSDELRKNIVAKLAEEHIFIKENGEMVIDEKARAQRQEWQSDPSQ